MNIIPASYRIEHLPPYAEALERFEAAARTCYKSEGRICPGSAERLLRHCLTNGHESTIEHLSMSVRFVVDRGVSHELVRHRLASYSQESTRYCAYGDGVTFIDPGFWDDDSAEYTQWVEAVALAEQSYLWLLANGAKPEQARTVLPNSTKTELVVTANFREWRHVFALRTAPQAHPQMREVMVPLLAQLKLSHGGFFNDL